MPAPTALAAPRKIPALLALCVGTALSLLVAGLLRSWEQREVREQVRQVAEERAEVLRGQIVRSMEVLHAIAALYDTRGAVSREEFGKFVATALARQPELQALAWDARVAGPERAAWERKAHDDGFPEFQFTEEQDELTLIPAATRAEYFPVFYLETLQRNRAAFGFDVGSEPRRRRAIEQARDTGQPAATAPLRLAQESASQRGFLVFEPLYTGPASTVEERRAHLSGFAVAVFRVGDLVASALRDTGDKGLAATITDESDGTVIYRQPAKADEPAWDTTLDVAGRRWLLRFIPTPTFRSAALAWQSRAALLAGLVISGLTAAFLWNNAERAAEIARSSPRWIFANEPRPRPKRPVTRNPNSSRT